MKIQRVIYLYQGVVEGKVRFGFRLGCIPQGSGTFVIEAE